MQINKNAQSGTSRMESPKQKRGGGGRKKGAEETQPEEPKKFGGSLKKQNQSCDADDSQHATPACSEIDKDVIEKTAVELQRRRVEDQAGYESRAAKKKPFQARG